ADGKNFRALRQGAAPETLRCEITRGARATRDRENLCRTAQIEQNKFWRGRIRGAEDVIRFEIAMGQVVAEQRLSGSEEGFGEYDGSFDREWVFSKNVPQGRCFDVVH